MPDTRRLRKSSILKLPCLIADRNGLVVIVGGRRVGATRRYRSMRRVFRVAPKTGTPFVVSWWGTAMPEGERLLFEDVDAALRSGF